MNATATTNYSCQTTAPRHAVAKQPSEKAKARRNSEEITLHLMKVETDRSVRDLLIDKLFNLENQSWQDLLLTKLLIRANIVPLQRLHRLVQEAQTRNGQLSRLLENDSLLPQECLDKLKELVTKIEDGSLTFDSAISAANQIYWNGKRIESALDRASVPSWTSDQSIIDFLLVAGLIDRNYIYYLQVSDAMPPCRVAQQLVSVGLLEMNTLQIATRARFLLNKQFISLDQAIAIVEFCVKYDVDVDSMISSCWPTN